ncbi:multiple epidermal growth factor-like domains protein 10 [Gigantopelta aegis]|uniref:multiple epidermal growth factor-like domains protein 10 n=1 Tax=Gigantopelta aegis TaxID=1735272 RepID=UPI001B889DB0|nr:multiple epidermal growth factor-like domains protein 10 [Gigantopelta aegis]
MTCGHCKVGSTCDKWNGNCHCETGWAPPKCTSCVNRYWGQYCHSKCGHCVKYPCNKQNGTCQCREGWASPMCTECDKRHWGRNCSTTCGHCVGNSCDKQNGTCQCQRGWASPLCKACEDGYYGDSCNNTCGYCLNGSKTCDKITGRCSNRCSSGWTGDLCKTACEDGYYGDSCNDTCGYCLNGNKTCDKITGRCSNRCSSGWTGDLCKTECTNETYGINCKKTCDKCKDSNCDRLNGTCVDGCIDGYIKPDIGCVEKLVGDYSSVGLSAGGVAAAVVFVVVVVAIVIARKRRPRKLRTVKDDVTDLRCTSPPGRGTDNDEESLSDDDLLQMQVWISPKMEDENIYVNIGQNKIDVANLHSFIQGKAENEFKEEYGLLPSGLQPSHDIGKKPCNKIKNRFVAIFPYVGCPRKRSEIGCEPLTSTHRAHMLEPF